MSVKVEVIEGGVPHQKILIAGLVLAVIGLYLSYLNVIVGDSDVCILRRPCSNCSACLG